MMLNSSVMLMLEEISILINKYVVCNSIKNTVDKL